MKKVLFSIVILFLVLFCMMLSKTLWDCNHFGKYSFQLTENTSSVNQTALEHLSGGLKIRTVSNPNYRDTDFSEFDKFIKYLRTSYPLIFKHCDVNFINRYNIVIRLKGKNPALKPNLLTAHYDVVGVKNEEKWQYPPFSGHYDKDFIYSRGTLDDKCAVFAILETVNDLLKNNILPNADLYIAFSHTEETGSDEGALKIIKYFKDKGISFNTALDEGGRIINKNGKYYAFVGISEKGRLLTKITLYGKGGHASSPYSDTAVKKLAKLVLAFASNPMNPYISDEILEYYKQTYSSYGFLTKFLISNNKVLRPFFVWKMSKNNEDNARIRSTAAITVIEASNVQNAVSSNASMIVDSRILPGQTTDDVKAYINKIIKNAFKNDNADIEYIGFLEPCEASDIESEEYRLLEKNIQNLYPDITVAPYLTLGATDARDYAEISDNTYRFLPAILTPDESALMHADNEKISVKNWERMMAFYNEFITSR